MNTSPMWVEHAHVALPLVDRWVRQAGQSWVQQGQIGRQLRHIEQLLNQLRTQKTPAGDRPATMESQLAGLSQQVRLCQNQLHDHATLLREHHAQLIAARQVPVGELSAYWHHAVAQATRITGRPAQLEIEGEDIRVDHDVLDQLAEPVRHLLDNAVDHGVEPPERRIALGKPASGTIRLRFTRDGQTLRVVCQDDGPGLDPKAIRDRALMLGLELGPDALLTPERLHPLIWKPGFSTRTEVSEISGLGTGLDAVAQRIRALQGHIHLASTPGKGCTLTLSVPAHPGTQHALLVRVGTERIALPTRSVLHVLPPGETSSDGLMLRYRDQAWPHARLVTWLGWTPRPGSASAPPHVVVRGEHGAVALEVDEIVEAREWVIQDVGGLLSHVPGLLGGSFTQDGQVVLLLDPAALERYARHPEVRAQRARARLSEPMPAAGAR